MSDTNQQPPADHSVKIPHLVFGLLFLGIAAVWALVVTDVITEDRLTVIAPAVLIGAGVIGLAASLASTRNRRNKSRPEYQSEYQPVNYPESSSDSSADDVTAEPEHDDTSNDHTKEIR